MPVEVSRDRQVKKRSILRLSRKSRNFKFGYGRQQVHHREMNGNKIEPQLTIAIVELFSIIVLKMMQMQPVSVENGDRTVSVRLFPRIQLHLRPK